LLLFAVGCGSSPSKVFPITGVIITNGVAIQKCVPGVDTVIPNGIGNLKLNESAHLYAAIPFSATRLPS
jgi:hypothetical protein